MSAYEFDELTKGLANGSSRRGILKMLGKVLVAGTAVGALTAIGSGTAGAAPRTCVTCVCGVGRPCNPKSSFCTEVRGFSAEQTCAQACQRQNQRLCGAGNAFHCPHGCP